MDKTSEYSKDGRSITTERLLLRRFSEDDAQEVFELAKDPDVGLARAGTRTRISKRP